MADAAFVELIAGCKGGNEHSFRRLMEEYQPVAYRLAFRMLCDEDDARDAVQQTFIRIWRGIGSYDPARAFPTWMYAIVSNVCLDQLRQRRRRSLVLFRREEDAVSEDVPDDAVTNLQLAATIRLLTGKLPAMQKLVFTLRDLEELSVGEVVSITGLSRDAVKANLWHARRAIRGILLKDLQRGERV